MKNTYIILTLTDQEIADFPFVTKNGEAPFYRHVCDLFGVS